MITVKPAPGKSVRDAELRDLLPAEGRRVPRTEYWLRRIAEGSEYTFVVRERRTGTFSGIAAVHDAQTPEPELGIWISEREHGKGYGREAVASAMRWCVAECSPEAFRYPVAVQNVASRRIAEGLGGRVVATEQTGRFEQVVYRIPAAPGSVKGI